MSSAPPSPSPDLARPAALAAFLRGIERRAAVVAELQTGDASVGDAALARAMAAFRDAAMAVPMADWPRLFWQALAGQPALRYASQARVPAMSRDAPPALRLALLLRMAAGLEDADAAVVLGVDVATLRTALRRALPPGAEAAAWSALQADVQQRLRTLPTERSLRLARMREAALAGPAGPAGPAERVVPRRRLPTPVRAIAAVAAAVLLALAATVWIERTPPSAIHTAALPPAGAPASTYARESGLIAHPDFALLANPGDEALARDAAFLAWTSGRAAPIAEVAPLPPALDIPETTSSADAP